MPSPLMAPRGHSSFSGPVPRVISIGPDLGLLSDSVPHLSMHCGESSAINVQYEEPRGRVPTDVPPCAFIPVLLYPVTGGSEAACPSQGTQACVTH